MALLVLWSLWPNTAEADNPSGNLRIELIAGYNFVVRSNIESQPGTSPYAAHLGARFCNDGSEPLTNVVAYIGNYDGGSNPTPGIYPSRAHPPLVGPLPGDEFALTHEGGGLGTGDAIRYLGTIEPGECVTVYWLVSYPLVDENGNAVHGPSVKPDDDLWLEFDVWGDAYDAGTLHTANERRRVHMRRMLQAMANKIYPNNANKVPLEYQDMLQQYAPTWTNTPSDGSPGTAIITEGIWYDLGQINQGFDNDGDLVPDYNVWLQPVGDPSLYEPACFRLVRTRVLLVIKRTGGEPDLVIIEEDELYFTNLPPDNSGGVGYVLYEFMPLRSGCGSLLTPYQAVASGKDNEKFNADYGATLGEGMTAKETSVAMDKSVDLEIAAPGETLTYTVSFTNDGAAAVGNFDLNSPLVVGDSIPENTTYIAGSAALSNILPAGITLYTIFYSTNSGVAWVQGEPSPASDVTDIQWWLSDPLQGGAAGEVSFQVHIDDPFPAGSPFVHNVAGLSLGNTLPFLEDDAATLITGDNTVSGTVFIDDGRGGGLYGDGAQNGTEPGIPNITVTLYYDVNGNGELDADVVLLATTNSAANGGYTFTELSDGYYIVVVDHFDSDLPSGHTPTTPVIVTADLDAAGADPNPVTVSDVDFGFAPVLALYKTGPAVIYEAHQVTYSIVASNRFTGDGGGGGLPQVYSAWATNDVPTLQGGNANAQFVDPQNAYYPDYPDGVYASAPLNTGNERRMGLAGYTIPEQAGTITNVWLLIPYSTSGAFGADDTLTFHVRTNANEAVAPAWTFTTNLSAIAASGTFTNNITSALATWNWSRFEPTNQNFFIQVSTSRSGGGTRTFFLDQAGVRVFTDGTIGASEDYNTLNPVPLLDYYNTNILEFVSAVPPVTSVGGGGTPPNTGRLSWDNVGPIYPGGSTNILVTFNVREPPGNVATTTINRTAIWYATFENGVPANTAMSEAPSEVRPTGTIGDFVWRDLNGDGIQDPEESGIGGVAVVLTPPGGVDVGHGPGNAITNVTDANGYYLFTGLPSNGVYTVTVLTNTLPGGVGVNTYDEDDGTDNPNNETLVELDVYATDGSDNHLTADFGYNNLLSQIYGTIWNDVNRNGASAPDPNEPFLAEIDIYLYDNDSVPVAATTTDANGYYEFFGSYDGSYTVMVDTNSGPLALGDWVQSFDTDGLGSPHEVLVTLSLGGSAVADFSYYEAGPYRIGDTIFYDWNGNGVQDSSDEGIPNVTVRLYLDLHTNGVHDAGVDPLIASTVTDMNGNYLFEDVSPGHYIVVVDHGSSGMPASFNITADPDGPMDGMAGVTIVDADNLDQDFGYQPLGTGVIGDTVWRDLNADGIQSGLQERGISNITVALQVDLNGDGHYVALTSKVTDVNGTYRFDQLPDGNYRALVDTADPDLPLDAFGNPWVPTTPTSYTITISGGNTVLTADFGFAALGAIGDTVFWDANLNGTQDDGEAGIPGVTVELYSNSTFVAYTLTDANGNYMFTQLWPGTYTVVVVSTGVLENATLSADPDADGVPCHDPEATGCDGMTTVTLLPGQNFFGADFGYVPAGGVIGDLVWIDFNNNGIRDPGEPGIPYVPLSLYSNATLVESTFTDDDGYYLFYGLHDGTYRVVVDTTHPDFPSGLTQTYSPDDTLDNQVTNIIVSGGEVVQIGGTPCTGCSLDVDFGYGYTGTNVLSGTVGMDDPLDIDGVLNGTNTSGVAAGEVAFAGVTMYVYLWNDNGNRIVEPGETVLVGTSVTDLNGDYAFTNLPPGGVDDYYIVSMVAPQSRLNLTTTTNDTPAVVLVQTLDAQGNTASAYQAVPVEPHTTNLDFAFISTVDYDFGDLPDSFSTLLPNGPRHILRDPPNLYLGQWVDAEPNGQPSIGADLDNYDDGVFVVGAWHNGFGGATLRIEVGAGAGWLIGFIDWNQSGTFVQANELVIANAPVSNTGGPNSDGVYTFTVTVPDGTISTTNTTTLYSRFRLFPNEQMFPALAFQGEADNGEVEDYRWRFNAISGHVYVDSDMDNDFSPGDTPQPGVIIELYDAATNFVVATVTDDHGFYNFYGVPDGAYHIQMVVPDGATAIRDVDGDHNGNDRIDIVLDGASLTQQNFLLDTDASVASISGTVWEDNGFGVPGNGMFDENDVPVGGVTLTLYRDINGDATPDPNEIIGSTISDENGYYIFSNLPDGNYLVVVTPPPGAVAVNDADGPANGVDVIEVPLIGTDIIERDFLIDGSSTTVNLGGMVWLDENLNGIREAGETNRFAGIPVALLDVSSNVLDSTVTDADGFYAFTNIATGTYTVRFDLTDVDDEEYAVTAALQGGDPMVNSDVVTGEVGAFAYTGPVLLSSNQDVLHIDLGLKPLIPLDLGVGKMAHPTTVLEGEPVTFTISVTNLSEVTDATGVELTDIIPAGFSFNSASPSQGSFDSDSGVWTVGSLVTGATASVEFDVTAKIGSGGYWWTNTVYISAVEQVDTNPANDFAEAAVLVAGVDLVLTKTVDNPFPAEEMQVNYSIVVSNAGPSDTTGVTVSEPLADGIIYISHTESQGTYDEVTGVWTIGALNVGQSETLTITAEVDIGTLGSVITNWSRITHSDLPDMDPSNNEDYAFITISDPGVTKFSSVTGYAEAGEIITYTIVITNRGAGVLTGLNVYDEVPAGTVFVPFSLTATLNPPKPDVPTSVVYNAGSSFEVPERVSNIVVEAWGGGGGGGKTTTANNDSGGGGGGGGYARSALLVTPGSTQTVTVGVGGATGTAGGSSWVGDTDTVFAQGGGAGGSVVAGSGGGNNVGNEATFNGGSGGVGVSIGGTRRGGGGGGSAYSNLHGGAGQPGDNDAGGLGGSGAGAGGDGTQEAVNGNPGMAPGGGGGGGGANAVGGAGGDGRVIISYTQPGNEGVSGNPPHLASGWRLDSGQSLTILYQVTVNNPVTVTQVCNTVSITTDQVPFPITDTVCDPIHSKNLVVIGERVWYDANGNGIQDTTETNGIANVPVHLIDTNHAVVASTITDEDGLYRLEQIVPGRYRVRFDFSGMASNVVLSPAYQGDDQAADSNPSFLSEQREAYAGYYAFAGGETNLTIDAGVTRLGATRAEIADVWGEWTGEGEIVWQTSSEVGTAGFFVYRVDPETGTETRINNTLVHSTFQPDGDVYRHTDPDAVEYGTAAYRLEEIERAGTVRDLGVYTVEFVAPETKAATSPRQPLTREHTSTAKTTASVPLSDCLKVRVQEDGIYGVSLPDIAAGMGRALDEIREWADDYQLSLRVNGQSIPYHYDAESDRLLFYAQGTDNWYTRDAVYWITMGEGLPMGRNDPGANSGVSVFPVERRFKEHRYPFIARYPRPEEFYYWDYVISSHPLLGQLHLELDVSGYAGGPVYLQVQLFGWSETTMSPDHLAELDWNGVPIGTVTFDNQDQVIAELEIPDGIVMDGINTFSVRGVLQEGHTHSFFVLDWVKAAYDRRLAPASDTIVFRAGDVPAASAEDFERPFVLSVEDTDAPIWIAAEDGSLPNAAWAVANPDERFALIEWAAVPLLQAEPGVCQAWFMDADNRIDYLVITSRELKAAAEELAAYREDMGLRAGVAIFEEICDLMTHGLRTPEAIPALLRYATDTWAESPWLVVLAGDGHYDYLQVGTARINHLPPMLEATPDGFFASDGLLTDLNSDSLPDVAVGRLPAQNLAELLDMLDKIRAYEDEHGEDWHQHLVLAADANDCAGNFTATSEHFADSAPGMVVSRIYLDDLQPDEAHVQLMSKFNAGAGIVHYTGHGGLDNFSGKHLLRRNNVSSMNNQRTPLVLALSCLVGRFEMPNNDSLGEVLVRKPGAGAVAVWGPSGLSRHYPAAELGDAFYRSALQEGSSTLGMAVLRARRALQPDLFTRDTYAIYNLLGDPALKLGSVHGGHEDDQLFQQWRWERFTPDELANQEISGAEADANEDGWNNYLTYAFDGNLSEGHTLLPPLESYEVEPDGTSLLIRWNQRRLADDLKYRLATSTDLLSGTWTPEPPGVQILSRAPIPDSAMERVTARLPFTGDRLYIRLDVIRK